MIKQFKITVAHGSAKAPCNIHIVCNGRLVLKDKGSAEQILQQVFGLLINSPQQLDFDITVTGSKEDVEAYKTMLNEWKLQRDASHPEPVLTQRQHDCAKLLKEGKNEKQISDELHIGYVWARKLCSRIYKAYHCHSKGELLSILLNKNNLH